jgi:drug/metabolite transporter (DMT)-like permease
LALVGLLGGAIPFLLFFHGLELATAAGGAATASFVYRTLFLMAAVFGVVLLGERFPARVVVAATLLVGGNLLLLSLISPLWTPGTTFVLAATVLWATEYSISKRLLRRWPSSTVGFGRMGFGALFLLGYLALTSQYGSVVAMSGSEWGWVALSATLLAAFVLTWYAGLQRTDLVVATSVLVLGFPVTWVLGIAARGTPFTAAEAVGAGAVASGVVLVAGWGRWTDLASTVRAAFPRRVSG